MRRNSWIAWVIILAAAFVVVETHPQIVPQVKSEIKETNTRLQPYLYLAKANIEKKLTGKTETTSEEQVGKVATPIEAPLKDMNTSSTYYYHFKSNVPGNVREVFLNAVTAYNNTGIVKLIPGTAQPNQNNITFSIYHKKIENFAANTVELGSGGPSALQLDHYAINSGRAGLNLTYPNLAIKDSVAMHELGHALGLGHSSFTNSVMYPVDQGVSKLSEADLNGLKNIYK
ncbi:M57 family metalloprotease [Companilactobacillus nantensis]|uniref:Zn-dependent protease n=1 Tax=Companilactobacillus nantensis DSM 16982 TaxID=1423774 RepID=A0A0R1WS02_9LACO|nr:M57 family metalloprotease [Companilactobacillus nantensis]KRM17196.1 Zn-dependent protease [Companilactobacillus nantensis DSM 16982]GEO64133.1 peptidase M10 [Companilactobacillus nantensis]